MTDDQPTRRIAGGSHAAAADAPTARIAAEPGAPTRSDFANGETLPFAGGPTAPPRADDELPRGASIGRYLTLSPLGRGGMGIVYAAYDPELDRRIAVKLLRAVVDSDASAGKLRMQREAQALARLSHPNVIAVHDVGTHADAVFIAMELVDGGTLRAWQAGRGWLAVIDAYIAAGRGLAAAHAAGLIHRDFKPENVLVGTDGRVRVTDFGLVRAVVVDDRDATSALRSDAELAALPASARAASTPTSSPLSSQLTSVGTVMGTPHYMAPEQLRDSHIGAAADQFAWCVALWEALYGARPFAGADFAALDTAMRAGPPRPPQNAVPRQIARVLSRGLAHAADARWPSMDAVIAALQRAAFRRRRVAVGGALAAMVALALGGVFALGRHATSSAAASCEAAGADAQALWPPALHARVASAFAATGAPYAAAAAGEVDRAVGGWHERWQASSIASCRATRVAHTQSDAMLDLRSACLTRALTDATALTTALADADRAFVENAAEVVSARLPDLDACNDVAVLAGATPPPRDLVGRVRVQALEARLDDLDRRALAAHGLPATDALVPVGRAIVDDATALGWAPLVARSQRALADLQRELGHGKDARTTLAAAVGAAMAGGDRDLELALYIELVDIETRLTSSYELANAWAALAAGALARVGNRPAEQFKLARERGITAYRAGELGAARTAFTAALALVPTLDADDPSPTIDVLSDLGLDDIDDNKYDAARTELARAADLTRRTLGASHPRYASILHDQGLLAYHTADYPTALVDFSQALALRIAAFGADDDRVGLTEMAIGTTFVSLGRLADAKPRLEHSLAILIARRGPDHPDVAAALNEIGGVYHRAGQFAESLAANERALAIRERALGPDHPDVAESLSNIAIEAKALGQWDRVEPNYRRAIAIFEHALGSANVQTAIAHLNLAEALRVRGKLDDAEAEYTRARAPMLAAFGADHPAMGHIWNGLGQLELARGHGAAAVTLLEHAIALREKDDGDPAALAESRFALARALVAITPITAAARERARSLATQARFGYAGNGTGFATQLAAIDAWLASNAPAQ